MRCITAIWPAGPPKLRAATRAHVQNASRNGTGSERSLNEPAGLTLSGVDGMASVDTNKLLRHAYATSEAELGRPSSDGEPASPAQMTIPTHPDACNGMVVASASTSLFCSHSPRANKVHGC